MINTSNTNNSNNNNTHISIAAQSTSQAEMATNYRGQRRIFLPVQEINVKYHMYSWETYIWHIQELQRTAVKKTPLRKMH